MKKKRKACVKRSDVLKDVGLNVRVFRKSLKITQIELAAKIGTSQSKLSKMEAGHLEMSAIHWYRLEKVLGVGWSTSSYDLLQPLLESVVEEGGR